MIWNQTLSRCVTTYSILVRVKPGTKTFLFNYRPGLMCLNSRHITLPASLSVYPLSSANNWGVKINVFEVFAVWASDVGRGGGGLWLADWGHVTRACAVVGGAAERCAQCGRVSIFPACCPDHHIIAHPGTQHSTVQYSTAQYSTVHHNSPWHATRESSSGQQPDHEL